MRSSVPLPPCLLGTEAVSVAGGCPKRLPSLEDSGQRTSCAQCSFQLPAALRMPLGSSQRGSPVLSTRTPSL